MSENDPIIPGCPSIFPHELPGGFDGVEPDCEAKKDDRHFRLGETSEKVKLHCAKVIEECRANTDFKGECHSVFVACYVDGRLEFAGADVTMCDKVQLDRAVARSQALNILARMNPYGDLSFAKDSADGTEH